MIVNIVETFNGIRAVQAFRREKRNDAIFAGLNGSYADANREAFRLHAVFIPGTTLISNISTVAVLLVGAERVLHGGMEIGVLTAFLLYLRQFFGPMEDVGDVLQLAAVGDRCAGEDLGSAVRGAERARTGGADAAAASGARPRHARPRRVRLHRRPSGAAELTLDIPAGQTVALVGATGAGKTTIAKLISRFYDPTVGEVRLDDVDLREVAEADLRRAVVMVTQDGFLFSGSVADNIGFGRIDARCDEIERAAREVGAHEFISALPDGYDTDVRKRGGRLSAGQRQLVAFARAFLADPAVLILDEATSSLDVPTERAVQRALRTVLADRTALIIAHRLSTVEIADRVLVLTDGRIVEDGTPGALLAEGTGSFAALHESWRDSLV